MGLRTGDAVLIPFHGKTLRAAANNTTHRDGQEEPASRRTRRPTLVQPAGDHPGLRLPSLDGPLDRVPAEVADDRRVGQHPRPSRQPPWPATSTTGSPSGWSASASTSTPQPTRVHDRAARQGPRTRGPNPRRGTRGGQRPVPTPARRPGRKALVAAEEGPWCADGGEAADPPVWCGGFGDGQGGVLAQDEVRFVGVAGEDDAVWAGEGGDAAAVAERAVGAPDAVDVPQPRQREQATR